MASRSLGRWGMALKSLNVNRRDLPTMSLKIFHLVIYTINIWLILMVIIWLMMVNNNLKSDESDV